MERRGRIPWLFYYLPTDAVGSTFLALPAFRGGIRRVINEILLEANNCTELDFYAFCLARMTQYNQSSGWTLSRQEGKVIRCAILMGSGDKRN